MNLKDIHILAVCSTTDFQNFTRRATLEAIFNKHPEMDLLLYNGVRSLTKKINRSTKIPTHTYYRWLPGEIDETGGFLSKVERFFRAPKWKKFFGRYDFVFFSDPNQYLLLEYIKNECKIVYLIRDPNVLQDHGNQKKEKILLERSDLVLATSKNLADYYTEKYHGMKHKNMHYWPNCVNMEIWNPDLYSEVNGEMEEHDREKIVGVAGNFGSKRTDYNLLQQIAESLPDVTFEIAGKLDRKDCNEFWEVFLNRKNIQYLGILPQNVLPKTVSRWSAGLVTDRMDEYASYMHHNKVYQYLSMGVPVVSLKIHDDYDSFHPYVRVAKNGKEFISEIRQLFKERQHRPFLQQCIKVARDNSAEKRAHYFLEEIRKL